MNTAALSDEFVLKAAKALADPTRIQVVKEVTARGQMSCSEIREWLPLSQPTISHHLTILIESGLLIGTKEGKYLILTPHWKNMQAMATFFQIQSASVKA